MMELGAETVFVGSGILSRGIPPEGDCHRGRGTYYKDAKKLAQLSEDLGERSSA